MENISEGERILLGYSPRDPFGGVESRSQRWNADLDVFGGPLRRSSTRSSRRIRADSIDLYSRLSRGRDDLVGSDCFCFGSGEKPVFGEIGGSSLRQHLEDDFYADIFQISEPGISSMRRGDAASLMSSSSSRVSSPNRPTQSSLSERMTKVSDHSAFDSPTKHPVDRSGERGYDAFSDSSSLNGSSDGFFTTQSVAGFGDLQNNGYGSNRQSPLSRKIPPGSEGFSEVMEPAFRTVESQTGKISSILEDYISNQQFHFSIYQWAGKGVMLVKPSDSNEINGFEGLTSLPEVIVQELELPTNCDYFFPVTKPLRLGTVIQDTKSDKTADDYAKTSAKFPHAESGFKLFKVTNIKSDMYGKQSEKASVQDFGQSSTMTNADVKQNPENSYNVQTKQNPELKSFTQLFDSGMNKQSGSHDIPIHVNEREAQSRNQKKEQGDCKLVPGEVNSTTLHDILSSSEDKARENNVKGKVKKFIKKISQLSPHKRKGAFEMLNRTPKGEDGGLDKFDELVHVFSLEPDKLQGGIGNKSIPLFDIPKFMENKVIEKTEEQNSSISCNDLIIDDCPSEESVEVLHTQSEDLNNAKCCEEIIHEDIEYLVQQLPVKQTEEVQISSQPDLIKKLDADIWQWSKGKEGNIRSLLSTLQLVLWPESGWKQVPLVNIIEGPSVKKAYQKALLCLHPDKLQQKGASWNQKYIAEKVFDILQEAWDNFNSMSQF